MNGGGSRHCGGDIIRSILVMDDSLNRISPLADEAAKADVTSSHQPATKGTCSLRRKERKDEGAVNEDNSIMKTRKRPVNFSSIGPSLQCPVCEVFLRPSELEKHCQIEVDRLHKSEAPSRKKVEDPQGNTERMAVKSPCQQQVEQERLLKQWNGMCIDAA
eukprot:m.63895 g.63895  ORF g.63895 m.63895 type:complete len:161 (+) comp35199_c0_seq4:305-787(+)